MSHLIIPQVRPGWIFKQNPALDKSKQQQNEPINKIASLIDLESIPDISPRSRSKNRSIPNKEPI